VYLVRGPLSWVLIAGFIAVCVAGPVASLSRHMKRGYAIALVYLGIVLTPVVLAAILIPPIVRQLVHLVDSLPAHIADLETTLSKNGQLDSLNHNFDLTGKLDTLAVDAAKSLGQAAGALVDLGSGLVSSVFALVAASAVRRLSAGLGGADGARRS
jgi:predicted PurR-regulated permease PerM